jgi:hypothetical protein
LETGPWTVAVTIAAPAAGTLSRPRMLVAAAPTTKKDIRAIMVIALVKQYSGFSVHGDFPDKCAIIKA